MFPSHHHHQPLCLMSKRILAVVTTISVVYLSPLMMPVVVLANSDEGSIVNNEAVVHNAENNYNDDLVCNDDSSSDSADQFVVLAPETSNSTEAEAGPACVDVNEDCAERAQDNGCIKDFEHMKVDCPATCLLCSKNSTTKSNNNTTAPNNDKNDSSEPIINIYSTHPQTIAHTDDAKTMRDYARRVDVYMFEQVYNGRQFTTPDRVQCRNRHAACTHWAATRGECNINPGYMKLECAPACFSCDELKYSRRCAKYLANQDHAWSQPGDLNEMFERALADPEYKSKLTVLSRPHSNTTTSFEIPDDGPWVIVIDDFLTAEECETMIQLGHERNYERSVDQAPDVELAGNLKAVVTQHRTSSTAWCDDDSPCYQNATTRAIIQKMERLTNISDTNSEYLQLLKYDIGQSYGFHHDYTPDHLLRPQGPRILTIFCYLNDVEAGGGTRFSLLNLTVTPKRGRIVIWPSVLDESPMQVDDRTAHEALPVEKGVKYGVNAWIHQRDFKTPFANHCS